MLLNGFRIQNFRSIVDTDWQKLAHDNITSLIGQNESGKTSVLEGLKAFYDGILIEDMLRSDLSLPRVSCQFAFALKDLDGVLDLKKVEPSVRELLGKLDRICIIRQWEDDMDSHLEMGEELEKLYSGIREKIAERNRAVEIQIKSYLKEKEEASGAVDRAEDERELALEIVESVRNRIAELKRSVGTFSSRNKKDQSKKETREEEEMLVKLEDALSMKQGILDEKVQVLSALDEKGRTIKRMEELEGQIKNCNNDLGSAQESLREVLQMTGMYPTDKEQRAAEIREEIFRADIEKAKMDLEALRKSLDTQVLALEFVFEGMSPESALKSAEKEMELRNKYLGSAELATHIFSLVPEFELFEDFSSLLPNRIDLEDIMRANKRAEGYKAAINFLTITGLEYSFFQQPSSRILKQKIENLNGELTLNFQDFWRQNVGKNNKIRINFELSHYDHTNPEKSGKPFIEFWIKDEKERLYPKQRSRGVRWFLSFFLELKATAMDRNKRNKVLLIDEPGVSLHARAQEDVLKVFDDIREQMQIIYTTHSPHLIDVNKLYRILAVQRAIEDDMRSESNVYSARSLNSATADTLSPIYATMGVQLNQQEIIKSFNNVIVKDLSTFYFLKAIVELTGFKKECYFLPASGAESIPMMVNILIGWGLDYIVLNFGNSEERRIHEELMRELFDNKIDLAENQMLFQEEFTDVEDLFSTIDFKKHIAQVREGITVSNSDYLKDNNFSRAVLGSRFLDEVNQGKITLKKLDEESRENLASFTKSLAQRLK